jgi:predicted Zn-dependent protease
MDKELSMPKTLILALLLAPLGLAAEPGRLLREAAFQEATAGLDALEALEAAASVHLREGRPLDAAALLESVLEEAPGRISAWMLLAQAYNHAQQPERALLAARTALKLSPGQPLLRLQAGLAHYGLGDAAAAVQDLAPVTRELPSLGLAHYFLGLSQGQLGQSAEAERSLQAAVEREPVLELLAGPYLAELKARAGQAAAAWDRLKQMREALQQGGHRLEAPARALDQTLQTDQDIERALRGERLRLALHQMDVEASRRNSPVVQR